MPQEKKYLSYTFQELPEKVQKKVLEKNRYINTKYFEWWDCTYFYWAEKLTEMGFNDISINFSGFFSQGDGASFTCKNICITQYLEKTGLKETFKILYNNDDIYVSGCIKRINCHYVHENSVKVCLDVCVENPELHDNPELNGKINEALDLLEKKIQEHIIDLNREIYSDLETEYNFLTSDDAIIENINGDEIHFFKNGEIDFL